MRVRCRIGIALLVVSLAVPARVALAGNAPDVQASFAGMCRLIDRAAAANRLPPGLLARVLWQESRFRPDATSRAGAIGIAQFMPPTATDRGLTDPRDPEAAIAASARFLAELGSRFGNFGLAAAAYNAGPARVMRWLHARAELPSETLAYVRAVTGVGVASWAAPGALPNLQLAETTPCGATAAPAGSAVSSVKPPPAWGGRLDRRLAQALSQLAASNGGQQDEPPPSRAARALCRRLRTLGARCIVYAQ